MLRPFDLIEDGDREVLAADGALALVVLDQVIEAEAEFAGARLELLGVAGDCRHLVAAPQRFVEDTAADVAGGADDRDVAQALVPFMRSRMAATVSTGASCGTLWPMRASMRRS